MLIRASTILLGAALLVSCGNNPAAPSFKDNCVTVAMDEEGQKGIEQAGTNPVALCDCATLYIATKPDDENENIRLTFAYLASEMTKTGLSAEDVAGQIVRAGMLAGEASEEQKRMDGLGLSGAMLDDVLSGFTETGQCPVAG